MEQLSKQRWFNNNNIDNSNLPLDTSILLYPTYTFTNNTNFITRLRLNICAPGNENSRKNKIILSLCRQYLKEQSTVTRDRLNGFLSRSIPNSRIILDSLDSDQNVKDTQFLETDPRGFLSTTIQNNYIPQQLRITLDTPSSFPKIITTTYDTHYIKPNGIGIISDIDDTIKHTGVTGDKKSMFKNVFVTKWEDWIIDGIPQWYNSLSKTFNVDFFYVSNSPLQLFPILQDYIRKTLPNGPIFLKQYAGSLFASIMNTSTSNRKLDTIEQILQDFPQKQFLLIGDSGEKDFETYIDIALRYPEQIKAIYIQCCKDSISDGSYNDSNVLNELNDIIRKQYIKPFNILTSSATMPPVPTRPAVPRKPTTLNLTDLQRESIRVSRERRIPPPMPPPLPRRPATTPSAIRSGTSTDVYVVPSTQNDYNTYDDYFDKKADSWKSRLAIGLRQLNNLPNFNIDIKFFMDPHICLMDSTNLIRNCTNNK
ncbi:hypothetical protein C6P45_000804 [Maudiozyma exigua]|uniref:Phosphatidate phosphatase APP1 catalytic domain-containing protein n=1 Tax=Maudiozyma exigua TaxID=34358 RepID=A0A9P6WGB6_MAUEX|nr:hypothetical protein C6P45_000804 [Kazachstania exigua]